MRQRIRLGKFMLLLGMLTDALGLILGGRLGFLTSADLLLEAGGLYLVLPRFLKKKQ